MPASRSRRSRPRRDNTTSAGSYRYEVEETIRSNGETTTITGSGTTSEDGKASTVHLDIPKVGSIEYRLIDRVMYMDAGAFPALASRLPAGKQWVSVDLDSLGGGDARPALRVGAEQQPRRRA